MVEVARAGGAGAVVDDVSAADVVRLAIALVRQSASLGSELAELTGLHPTDVRALQALDLAGGSVSPLSEPDLTMGELARRLGLTASATTALVGRLEARDLVRREPVSEDKRRTRVVLGPAAATFGQEHLAPLAERLRQAAADLDPDERTAVARFLGRVLEV